MWGQSWGAMIWGGGAPVPMLGPVGWMLLGGCLLSAAVLAHRHTSARVQATLGLLVALAAPIAAIAAVTLPHSFSNGSVADADEVNANFAAVASAVAVPSATEILDTRSGCPAIWPANSPLVSHTVNLADDAVVSVQVEFARRGTGRHDLILVVDGAEQRRAITYTSIDTWVTGTASWVGTLAAGSHTFDAESPSADVWGCGSTYGVMNVLVLE